MFNQLFSLVNIFNAWRKFRLGKTRKNDVISFEYHLEDNILSLYEDISVNKYKHGEYEHFQVFDNKKRDIYKAKVRDRVVHQIIYDYLLSIYEKIFISDSYSSRNNKGHHKAIKTLRYFIRLASDGNKEKCFVLKCDIKKYFDNVDHTILFRFIKGEVECSMTISIIQEIISSFDIDAHKKGIPLGNITSQIFANIYLHILDMYIKEELRCRFYIRYNDDLVIISNNEKELEKIKNKIMDFVYKTLKLNIPIEKTSIRKVSWGIDFLGYVILPNTVLLRDKTKGKMYEKINKLNINSYFGLLKHCNSYNLRQKIISKVMDNESDLHNE